MSSAAWASFNGFPDVIGEGRAAAVFAVFAGFAGAKLGRAAHVEAAGLTKGLKEAVEEDLRLALFVARDVRLAPRGEFREFVPARHGGGLHEDRRGSNAEFGHQFCSRDNRRTPAIQTGQWRQPGRLGGRNFPALRRHPPGNTSRSCGRTCTDKSAPVRRISSGFCSNALMVCSPAMRSSYCSISPR